MNPPLSPRPRLRDYGIALLAWTLYGLLGLGQTYAGMRLGNEPPPPASVLIAVQLPPYLLWALATPSILRLSRRIPAARGERTRWAMAHLALYALLAVGSALSYATLARATGWSKMPISWGDYVAMMLVNRALGTLVLYAVVAAIGAALWQQRALRERELRGAQLEAQLAEARLLALRSQLHPHFLFNALNTLAMHLRESGSREGVEVVVNLAELLRRILRDEGDESSLEQELELLDLYLAVERGRFADRLQVEIETDAAARRASVPVLLLQPLVENAIRHGIGRKSQSGRLAVRAEVAGDRLRLSVEDDGAGFPADAREGVGLGNTRARLAQLYPGEHTLEIESGERGTTIALTLPYRPLAAHPLEIIEELHAADPYAHR